MATNDEVIQYYGRSSQTVHRYNPMVTAVDEKVPNNVHQFENLIPPESYMEKWNKQFYSLNIPTDLSHGFTPGVMVRSETVQRNESVVATVSAPASLRELPSPKSLFHKKRASQKRKLDNDGLPFSAVVSHLRAIKAKQAKFEWGLQWDTKCFNRKLNFETSTPQVISNDSEDPIETTSLTPLDDQVFENYAMQVEQITVPLDPKISSDADEQFTFCPKLMFEHYKKQQESQSDPTKALFNFAEE